MLFHLRGHRQQRQRGKDALHRQHQRFQRRRACVLCRLDLLQRVGVGLGVNTGGTLLIAALLLVAVLIKVLLLVVVLLVAFLVVVIAGTITSLLT